MDDRPRVMVIGSTNGIAALLAALAAGRAADIETADVVFADGSTGEFKGDRIDTIAFRRMLEDRERESEKQDLSLYHNPAREQPYGKRYRRQLRGGAR